MPFNSERHGNPPLTPAWALECWLWEDDVNTAERVDELLRGYAEHDIPVRTILIDSPWSTRYNDFEVDTLRYPQPDKWFRQLENDGYRVVLWMTSMVNSFSKDTAIKNSQVWYDGVAEIDFLAGGKLQSKWWKGRGGFIDYSNPAAKKWWQAQQQNLFDLGIDGWKLDGTATFFSSRFLGLPVPYLRSYSGIMTTRQYMDSYYREEYLHGKKQNPEFVTLARALDGDFIHPEGFAPIDAAPVTWVGDQEHIWQAPEIENEDGFGDKIFGGSEGLETAIKDILNSAKLGYNIIGSDVAGFSGREIPANLYIRWAQFSTFCGLFLNGGHGERALWKRSQTELQIIRKFSWLHTELVPYIYNYVVSAHAGGKVLQRSTGIDYNYFFGDDFFVAPIFQDSFHQEVVLPPGRWRYFFDDRGIIDGGNKVARDFPLDEYPFFVRDGAIIPLNIKRDYTGFGDQNSAGYLTWLIYPHDKNKIQVFHPDNGGETTVAVEQKNKQINVKFTGHKMPHILLIATADKPKTVLLDNKSLKPVRNWNYDATKQRLKITTDLYENGNYQIDF
ncbi:MAG: glycoside hydrolase family 31 protein [Calditrichaeota bacterium]|nr:MAG: glycoside hydrolase family 31 protein [Calditrichota bacterium]